MKRWFMAVCAAALATFPAEASAQDTGDDWEFVEDASLGIVAAMVRFDGGQAIVAQCRAGELNAVLLGLPIASTWHRMLVSRADGRTDIQTWAAAPGQTASFKTSNAGRDLRFMRGGGALEIRSGEGAATPFRASFDLPAQSANLDRVLSACGWPAQDERDAMPLLDGPVFTARVTPRPTAPSTRVNVSCLVRNSRTQDCRPDQIRPGREAADAEAAARGNGDPLQFGRPGDPAPDGVIYTTVDVPDRP